MEIFYLLPDHLPDWQDVNKRISVLKGTMTLSGTLCAEAFFTGEDEVPVFYVQTDDGQRLSLYEMDGWKLC